MTIPDLHVELVDDDLIVRCQEPASGPPIDGKTQKWSAPIVCEREFVNLADQAAAEGERAWLDKRRLRPGAYWSASPSKMKVRNLYTPRKPRRPHFPFCSGNVQLGAATMRMNSVV